jgi:hypothetical protein
MLLAHGGGKDLVPWLMLLTLYQGWEMGFWVGLVKLVNRGINMKDLNTSELLLINGGSEESYGLGYTIGSFLVDLPQMIFMRWMHLQMALERQ